LMIYSHSLYTDLSSSLPSPSATCVNVDSISLCLLETFLFVGSAAQGSGPVVKLPGTSAFLIKPNKGDRDRSILFWVCIQGWPWDNGER
jgi:hypothetical protein